LKVELAGILKRLKTGLTATLYSKDEIDRLIEDDLITAGGFGQGTEHGTQGH
jgi:hypothetical protein